jgi:hypothetical protein
MHDHEAASGGEGRAEVRTAPSSPLSTSLCPLLLPLPLLPLPPLLLLLLPLPPLLLLPLVAQILLLSLHTLPPPPLLPLPLLLLQVALPDHTEGRRADWARLCGGAAVGAGGRRGQGARRTGVSGASIGYVHLERRY